MSGTTRRALLGRTGLAATGLATMAIPSEAGMLDDAPLVDIGLPDPWEATPEAVLLRDAEALLRTGEPVVIDPDVIDRPRLIAALVRLYVRGAS